MSAAMSRTGFRETGEVVIIPKRLSVKFSVGKFLFEDLNK